MERTCVRGIDVDPHVLAVTDRAELIEPVHSARVCSAHSCD